MSQRRYTVWVDTNGFTRLTLLNSSAGASAVEAAILAQSNADVLNSADSTLTVNGSPSPVAATYQRVADSAGLLFQDAMGEQVIVQLPAPKAAIFLADQVTVDPTAIAVLIAAVVGTVLTGSGNPVTSYVGGTRRPTTRENYQ